MSSFINLDIVKIKNKPKSNLKKAISPEGNPSASLVNTGLVAINTVPILVSKIQRL
jgi:hypothetical protein